MKTVAKINRKNNKKNTTFELVLMILLSILLFYPPFFRGLFVSFTKEVLMTHILSFGLFILYLIYKQVSKEKIILNSIVDYIGLFLIIAYTLPVIFGQWANLREAIGEIIRYANVFMIYLMVKDFAANEKYKKIMLTTLVASGVLVALVGLFSAIGFGELRDAVVGTNRISSTFQYPNTLAAYLGILFFISFALMNDCHNIWKKNGYALAGFIMFFTFVFTYSRAAWLLIPFFAVALIILITAQNRINAITYLASVGIPSLIAMQPFSKYLGGESKGKALLVLGLSLLLFAGLYLFLEYLKAKIKNINYKAIYALLAMLILAGAGLGYIAFTTTQPLIMDNMNITEDKVNSVNRSVSNIYGNQSYTLKMELEATTTDETKWPWRVQVFGLNDKNERELLVQELGVNTSLSELEIPIDTNEDTKSLLIYFTNLYPDTRVTFKNTELYDQHNNLIHEFKLSYKYIPESIISRLNAITLSDKSSTARLLFYKDALTMAKDHPIVGAGGGAWENLYLKYQSEPYDSTTTHSYILSTLVDVGLVGVSILLALIVVLLIQLFKMVKEKNTFGTSLLIGLFFLLTHSTLDFNFSYFSIVILFWVIIGMLNIRILPEKLTLPTPRIAGYIMVLPLLILSISLYSGHTSAQEAVQAVEANDGQGAYEAFNKAVKRDPFTYNYRLDRAQLMQLIGESSQNQVLIEEAENEQLKALQYAPSNLEVYQKLISYYIDSTAYDKAIELASTAPNLAPYRTRSYELKFNAIVAKGTHLLQQGELTSAMELYRQAEDIVEDLTSYNEKTDKPIVFSDSMLLAINKIKYIMKNIEDVAKVNQVNNLVYSSYFDMDADEDSIPDGWRTWVAEGSKFTVETMAEKGVMISSEPESSGLLYTNNMSLKPNTKYQVEIELAEGSSQENARVAIHSRKGTVVQLQPMLITDHHQTFEFETTDDIEEGYQYLRVEHMAKTSEPFTLKSILIFELE